VSLQDTQPPTSTQLPPAELCGPHQCSSSAPSSCQRDRSNASCRRSNRCV